MWSTEQKPSGILELAAVADQEHLDVAQLGVAVRAALRLARRRSGRLGVRLARLPVRVVDRPRDDVLEAAEDGAPLAGGLVGAEAVVGLHVDSHTRYKPQAMAELTIVVLEGDQTGQELLEQSLRVLGIRT